MGSAEARHSAATSSDVVGARSHRMGPRERHRSACARPDRPRRGLPRVALALLGSCLLLSWEWKRQALTLSRGPYLQSVTDRSATLVCRTDASSAVTLRYGRSAAAPWEGEASSPPGTEHVFALSGLRPETRYAYELVTDGAVLARGESCSFRTAPPPLSRAPFRFLAWGDSGLGSTRQLDVAARMEELLPVPDFAVLLGDLVYPDGEPEDYDPKFFGPYADLFPRTPFWPTLGNHDVNTQNGAPYFDAFFLPATSGAPGNPSNTEKYYSFDHGMAHFVCVDGELSSSSPGSPMALWLEADLADARARGKRWLIAYFHRPPYSKGTHDSDSEGQMIRLREDLVPLFEAQGVDLVASGHSHNYERSYLARNHAVLQNHPGDYTKFGTLNGTIYLVSGCGGQSGGGDLNHPLMSKSLGSVAGFSVIDVSWEELRGSFVERNGATLDIFTLRKTSDSKPPGIAALEASTADEIRLVFDEPVAAGTGGSGAENPANYSILPPRAVLGATLSSDARTVVLSTAALQTNRAYQVAVREVTDLAGNEVLVSDAQGWLVLADAADDPPQAVASTHVTAANAPATIEFSAARTTAGGAALSSVLWDFGDGSPAVFGALVSHVYERTGSFTASLIATDVDGLSSVARVPIRIHAQGTAPLAFLTANVLQVDAGGTVGFGSANSRDPDGGTVFVSWDFGDPASGTANHSQLSAPTHTYAVPGVYTVVLTVVDDEGSGVTDSAVIVVQNGGGSSGDSFAPVADARITSGTSSNFGSESTLRLRAPSPESRSYLRFDVAGVGSVTSAKLRLFVGNSSDDAGSVYAVSNAWNENTITWNNAPPITGNPLDSGGEADAGSWVEYDVGSVVDGAGSYSFALTSTSTDTAIFFSREGSSPPELVIEHEGPAPDTTAPHVTGRSPAPNATSVPRTTNVSVTFDEPVQGVSGSTFTLKQGTTSIAAQVSYDSATRTALLDPSSGLAPDTTYRVDLTGGIRDLAAQPNALAPLSWTFTTAEDAPTSTVTVTTDADARVSTNPGNYGTETTLRLRAGSPEFRSYVRFQVSGVSGSVSSARLRLFVTEASDDAGTVFGVTGAWTETGITWNNAPPIAGSALATGGAATNGSWEEYDVTSAVVGNGTYSFVLTSSSSDTVAFSSREGANPPQLVVTAGGTPADTTAPVVTNRAPAPNATSVPRTTNVSATFDEPVQGVSGSSFTLKQGTTSVAAQVSYDAATRTALLNPSSDLAPDTTYTVALTSAIRDLATQPNALVPLAWSFTTEEVGDTTAPQVTGRSPAPGASSVARTTNVSATFDEPVQGVSGSSFTLKQGTTSIAAQVSYDGGTRTALLNPTSNLAPGTTYSVALTSTIRDLAAQPNALVPLAWSFTTEEDPTAPVISAAVADARVTESAPTANNGAETSLRVRAPSPASRSYLRFQVSGIAGSVTSARLRLFVTDPSDDAGSVYAVSPSWTESTITWNSAPAFGANPLDSGGVASDETWVEYDVTSAVSGDGTYAFALTSASTDTTTFSSREGTNPPQLVVTGGGAPPDTTAPLVTNRSPSPGATSVQTSTDVTATFDEPVQGVSGTSFTLKQGTTAVQAQVTYDAPTRTARLDPTAALAHETTYTVSLTSAIRDLAVQPNALAPLSWSFTTEEAPDTTAPQVTGRSPAPGAMSVPRTTNVIATFDEPVQGISGSSFTLKQGTTSVPAQVSYDAATRTALLNPTSDLVPDTTYTVALTSAIRDLAAQPNALAPLGWSFTTEEAPTSIVTVTAEADARTNSTSGGNYGSETTIRLRGGTPEFRSYVRFQVSGITGGVSSARLRLFVTEASNDAGTVFSVSNAWSESTINWNNAPPITGSALATGGAVSAGTWKEYDVTPAISGNGTCSFVLTSASTDSVVFSSREGANSPELVITAGGTPADTTAPLVTSRTPAPGATAVERASDVTATFDEPVQGVSAASFTLRQGTTSIAAQVSYDGATRTARLDPAAELAPDTTYTASLTSAIQDLAAQPNTLAPLSWSFTTEEAPISSMTLTAAADAHVSSTSPGNYGSETALRLRAGSPEFRSYLRFDVSGIAGGVISARLRLFVTDASSDAGSVYAVGNGWTEGGITWSNAPAIAGSPLVSGGAASNGSWKEYDVTSAFDGDGTYSFALTSSSTDSAVFSSSEGTNPPELVLQFFSSAQSPPEVDTIWPQGAGTPAR